MRFASYALILALIPSLGLVACGEQAGEDGMEMAMEMDMAELRADLEAMDVRWAEGYTAGDAAAVAALYAEDATLLPPNVKKLQGRAAIQAFFKAELEMGATDLGLTTISVGGAGDIAYVVGRYTVAVPAEGGEMMRDEGKYLAIHQHQADGTWKLKFDTWNSDLPLE